MSILTINHIEYDNDCKCAMCNMKRELQAELSKCREREARAEVLIRRWLYISTGLTDSPDTGEFVVVRRDDLRFVVTYFDYRAFDTYSEQSQDRRVEAKEITNRLKATLKMNS